MITTLLSFQEFEKQFSISRDENTRNSLIIYTSFQKFPKCQSFLFKFEKCDQISNKRTLIQNHQEKMKLSTTNDQHMLFSDLVQVKTCSAVLNIYETLRLNDHMKILQTNSNVIFHSSKENNYTGQIAYIELKYEPNEKN